ncbi:hypothetical protein TeGR_g6375 [Tetraparma gracilis]|uniref:Uncharacterized protein n=1 Tax=Tetraparma gracilis TaxID=2962635 RepID=A0ABQ6MH94_9STRA|nr:hypothetical protein TeGR_g6375 [Tetraparma gracilis]
MSFCSNCGSSLSALGAPGSVKFCPSCGAPQAAAAGKGQAMAEVPMQAAAAGKGQAMEVPMAVAVLETPVAVAVATAPPPLYATAPEFFGVSGPSSEGVGDNIDLARYGTASASTCYGHGMTASKAIRGSFESSRGFGGPGDYCHTAANDSIPTWEVQLKHPARVSSVHVYGRPGYGRRLKNVTVRLLDSGGRELHEGKYENEHGMVGFVFRVPDVVGVSIVRLTKTGRERGDEKTLNLNAVQVYGADGITARGAPVGAPTAAVAKPGREEGHFTAVGSAPKSNSTPLEDESGINLALSTLGATASASSCYGHGMVAQHVIRGSFESQRGFGGAGTYCHTAAGDSKQTLEVALFQPAAVQCVHVYGRPGYGRRLRNVRVQLLDEARNVLLENTFANPSQSPSFVWATGVCGGVKFVKLSKLPPLASGDDRTFNVNAVCVFGSDGREESDLKAAAKGDGCTIH